MSSSKDMLTTVAQTIKKIKKHPGHIIVIGAEQGDISIVNVYTMTLLK
jgi:hypothetical protein